LLGVTPEATEAEVRAAFRRKVIENHPDTAVQSTDESTVRRLIDAYRLLIDSAPRTGSGPAVTRVGGSAPGVHPVDVKHGPTDRSQLSRRVQPWCQECMATGLRIRRVTCPACRGGSVLTTLDISQARVAHCRRCGGRGRLRSLELCRACEGTGVDRS
jgi:DnaJ-class molecular chaperone